MALQFIKSSSPSVGEAELQRLLSSRLSAGKRLLWIVTGGSNVPITIRVMSAIDSPLTKNLHLLLSDERYGYVNHLDSNYFQLINGGLDLKQATFAPILTGVDFKPTLDHFAELFESEISWADEVIGQLGIGSDGHIAGILPGSTELESHELVVGYEAAPYSRLSLSLEALKRINLSYVFCFGQNKHEALTRVKTGGEQLSSLPALILNTINKVKVYNDFLEGTSN